MLDFCVLTSGKVQETVKCKMLWKKKVITADGTSHNHASLVFVQLLSLPGGGDTASLMVTELFDFPDFPRDMKQDKYDAWILCSPWKRYLFTFLVYKF